MRSRTSRYFTFALLAFLASFLLLPNSKAVNNFYYVFLALPALILILFGKVQRPYLTTLVGLWAGLFTWIGLSGVGSDIQFFKHLLYVLLFCLTVWLWVDWQQFQSVRLFRAFLWGLIIYTAGSALFYWLTGSLEVGARVLSLPSRLEGPILTSMLIVSCFALVLPEWLRSRCWLEMTSALLASLFCIGFVLQSRSGLVGLAFLMILVFGGVLWRFGWWLRSGAALLAGLSVAVGMLLLQHSEVAIQLVARADSGRFELWKLFLQEWSGCGLLLGCGPAFSGTIQIENGLLIHHPHNIFLTMGFHHGLPGLLLFSLVMMATLWQAWKQRNPWGGYLLIALFMLNFDGRELINSPHEVWLLVLVPSMLIAAQQRVARNAGVAPASDPVHRGAQVYK